MDITKHFELPASTRESLRFERDNVALFDEDQRLDANHYPDTALSGRPVMIA